MAQQPILDFDQAIARARGLSENGRVLIGVCGAPGSGKSFLSQRLDEALGDSSVLVPMDGFHLSNEYLIENHMRQRKGAWDTFDVLGYVSLLERLRENRDPVVFAPRFEREIEQSIGSADPVSADKRIIITEGNYLLLAEGYWPRVPPLLDEIWFRDVDAETRVQRLVCRRLKTTGEDRQAALEWVMNVDMPNGVAVEATMAKADAIIRAEL